MRANGFVLLVLLAVMTFVSPEAAAQGMPNPGQILDDVLTKFQQSTASWSATIQGFALWLFWVLVTLSMVWTFGLMALRKADFQEFISELMKMVMFVGFFLWLLTNGPTFATNIVNSLITIANRAGGTNDISSPSLIVANGFNLFFTALDRSSMWEPVDSAFVIVISLAILLILTLIAVNMMLLLISAWILAYAGVYFLGFGGSKWTSDMAIKYYRTVLNVAAQLMTMVLIVAIGMSIINDTFTDFSGGNLTLKSMGVTLVIAASILMLVKTVPSMIGNLSGGETGNIGISGGGLMGIAAAGTAAAGVAAMGAAQSMVGGGSAVSAAIQAAQQTVSSSGGPGGIRGGMAVAAGAAGNLASAAKSVMADSGKSAVSSFMGQTGAGGAKNTFGGRVAETIRAGTNQGSAGQASASQSNASQADGLGNFGSFGPGQSASAGPQPKADEVADFANKNTSGGKA